MKGWLKLVFLLLFQVTDCHIPDISRQWDYIIQFFFFNGNSCYMQYSWPLSFQYQVIQLFFQSIWVAAKWNCKRPNSLTPQLNECTYCSKATERKLSLGETRHTKILVLSLLQWTVSPLFIPHAKWVQYFVAYFTLLLTRVCCAQLYVLCVNNSYRTSKKREKEGKAHTEVLKAEHRYCGGYVPAHTISLFLSFKFSLSYIFFTDLVLWVHLYITHIVSTFCEYMSTFG